VVDSALYYLDVARRDSESREAAMANELALLVRRSLPVAVERLEAEFEEADLFYQNNLLSLYNQAGAAEQAPSAVNPEVLRELGGIEAAWLLNYAMLRQEPDSALPRQLQELIEATPMSYYQEPANLALGILLYKQQNHFAAFRKLEELAQGSVYHNALYYQLQGSWALEQEAPALAAGFFRQAYQMGNTQAGAYLALSLAEEGSPAEAAQVWLELPDSLLSLPMQRSKSEALFLMGTRDFTDYPGNSSEAAYKALRWQWGNLSREALEALLAKMDDEAWRNRALLLLAELNLEKGSLADANDYLQQFKPVAQGQENESLLQKEQQLRQRLSLLENGQPIESGSFIYPATLGQLYASATQAQLAGDTTAAMADYIRIMQATPFLPEAYLASVPLLNRQGREGEAYDFLLKALQFNPEGVLLKEAYILQSLRLGLEQYAAEELQNLQELVREERYDRFLEKYQQVAEEQSTRQGVW
jgi:hypothetical protein